MFKSDNTMFYIFKEPNTSINQQLWDAIEKKRNYQINRTIGQVNNEDPNFKIPRRPPNLMEYLIARGKALNLRVIRTLARDLLLTI